MRKIPTNAQCRVLLGGSLCGKGWVGLPMPCDSFSPSLLATQGAAAHPGWQENQKSQHRLTDASNGVYILYFNCERANTDRRNACGQHPVSQRTFPPLGNVSLPLPPHAPSVLAVGPLPCGVGRKKQNSSVCQLIRSKSTGNPASRTQRRCSHASSVYDERDCDNQILLLPVMPASP